MLRRLFGEVGASQLRILAVQGNLAGTYQQLGRFAESLRMRQEVYSGYVKLLGEEDIESLEEASNYAVLLKDLERFKEAKSLLRKTMPVARRIIGYGHIFTLRMRWIYGDALYEADGATLDDLREAVTTLEDTARIARRVLGGAHPFTVHIERTLQNARSKLVSFEALSERMRDLSVS